MLVSCESPIGRPENYAGTPCGCLGRDKQPLGKTDGIQNLNALVLRARTQL